MSHSPGRPLRQRSSLACQQFRPKAPNRSGAAGAARIFQRVAAAEAPAATPRRSTASGVPCAAAARLRRRLTVKLRSPVTAATTIAGIPSDRRASSSAQWASLSFRVSITTNRCGSMPCCFTPCAQGVPNSLIARWVSTTMAGPGRVVSANAIRAKAKPNAEGLSPKAAGITS